MARKRAFCRTFLEGKKSLLSWKSRPLDQNQWMNIRAQEHSMAPMMRHPAAAPTSTSTSAPESSMPMFITMNAFTSTWGYFKKPGTGQFFFSQKWRKARCAPTVKKKMDEAQKKWFLRVVPTSESCR